MVESLEIYKLNGLKLFKHWPVSDRPVNGQSFLATIQIEDAQPQPGTIQDRRPWGPTSRRAAIEQWPMNDL
jgi:hypothetical protein